MRVGRLIVTLPFMVGACYTYRPVTASVAPSGMRVKAALSDVGRVNVAPFVGQGVTAVEGEVLESNEGSVTLSLTSVTRLGEGSSTWAGERLRLQRADIAQLGEKSISRTKTAWVASGVGLAVALFALGAQKMGGPSGGSGDKGGNPP
jgi:hypothetical protein